MRIPALILGVLSLLGAHAIASATQTPEVRYDPAQYWGAFERELLHAHNRARADVGVAPLTWDPGLAAQADAYARKLAQGGRMVHSAPEERGNTGENLWTGTAGHYDAGQMMAMFTAERQYFRAGTFPNIATNGNWASVGHHTQIIWPTTTRVGCALARGRVNDFLVCRYDPAGNMIGQPVG